MTDFPESKDEQTESLDQLTKEAIEAGLESERSGNYSTLEQAVQFARERRKSWKKSPPTKTA